MNKRMNIVMSNWKENGMNKWMDVNRALVQRKGMMPKKRDERMGT